MRAMTRMDATTYSESVISTPNRPYSGLSAYSRPSSPKRIQAMSSPSVSTFQPGMVGSSIARLVLPQALGKAAAT